MRKFLKGVTALLGVMGLSPVAEAQTLPVHTPLMFVLAAEVLAMAIGLLAGVLPARRAMQLNPVDALRGE